MSLVEATAVSTDAREENRLEQLKRTVSASRLNCFHSCRLKFYFRYVLELSKETPPALFLGKVVHWALQQWSKNRWRGSATDPESLKLDFISNWEATQAVDQVEWESGEESQQQEKAWNLVEMYLQETPIPPDEKPEGVEVVVEADLSSGPKLLGVIDLVRPRGKVVDFKTSATTPQAEHAIHRNLTQLTAYGILHREATGSEASGFELHHLIKTKTPKLVVTTAGQIGTREEDRFHRLVDSYITGIDLEDWVPSPGMQCLSCEFFNECSRHQHGTGGEN